MNTKQLLKLIGSLFQARINDLEAGDLIDRVLISRLDHQKRLLGLLVELQRDRFSGNEAELEEMSQMIAADDSGELLVRIMNRTQQERDKLAAMVIELNERIERMPDAE